MDMTLVLLWYTALCLTKYSANWPLDPEAGFVEQNLKLSCSFRSDQIYKYQRFDSGLVLLKSDLDVQQTRPLVVF